MTRVVSCVNLLIMNGPRKFVIVLPICVQVSVCIYMYTYTNKVLPIIFPDDSRLVFCEFIVLHFSVLYYSVLYCVITVLGQNNNRLFNQKPPLVQRLPPTEVNCFNTNAVDITKYQNNLALRIIYIINNISLLENGSLVDAIHVWNDKTDTIPFTWASLTSRSRF